MSIKGSSGIMVDLYRQISQDKIADIYQSIWDLPEFEGPQTTLQEFMGIPRAAEGKFVLEGESEIFASCYTKFELDSLGYPDSCLQPLILTISFYNLSVDFGQSIEFKQYMIKLLQQIDQIQSINMAVIGDVTLHYINSLLLHEVWFDHHGSYLETVFVPETHPFRKVNAGQTSEIDGLYYYSRDDIKQFNSDKSSSEKASALSQWAHSQFEKILI